MLYMDGLKKVRDELLLHANGVAHIGVRRSAISQKVWEHRREIRRLRGLNEWRPVLSAGPQTIN